MSDDRTKPPPGVIIEVHTKDSGPHVGLRVFERNPLVTLWSTESEAIAAAWAHRDSIAAEALREAAHAMHNNPDAWQGPVDWLDARADELDTGPDRKAEP